MFCDYWKQTFQISGGLLYANSWFQPGYRTCVKTSEGCSGTIPLQGKDQRWVFLIEEMEGSGKNSNDFPGDAAHRNRAADNR